MVSGMSEQLWPFFLSLKGLKTIEKKIDNYTSVGYA
jgi:hypothetical protein